MRVSIRGAMLASAVLQLLLTDGGRGEERPRAKREAKQDVRLVVQVGHVGRVQSVAFAPNGKQILTAGDDQTARLWDAQTGMELLTFAGHTGLVWEVKFSPD